MNRDEAKSILMLHRPGTVDESDPQIAEALAFAKADPELACWLEAHLARQKALRGKFQEIAVPDGLKEQIISEQRAFEKMRQRRKTLVAAAAAVAAVFLALASVEWSQPKPGPDDTFAVYQSRMAGIALRGYAMDLATNNLSSIRDFLAANHAPADYVLPAGLEKSETTGCAVETWQGTKVSMICFRTGKPLRPGQQNDLWLFVVDRGSVKTAPDNSAPQIATVNRLTTASWVKDGKLYVLGTESDAELLRRFL